MKTTTYYLSLIGTLVATLGFAAFTGAPTNDVDNSSRIIFSHELHAMMAGCEDCHDGVAESESLADLALPGKPACENCHDVEDDDNCGMCHPDDTFEALVDDEDELIFNHKAHADYDAECLDCHKGIDEVDYGSEAPAPPMAQCYQCHNDGRASNDMGLVASNACEMCHVSTANLVPDDHLAANFDNEHGHESELADADCQM
ncbi:MAG: cytochrome C, partial [Ignavibacteriales bacterium]|nr:cytochrome C [Ignavibacteriales bacterium]